MSSNVWTMLDDYFSSNDGVMLHGLGVHSSQIKIAEDILDLKFSDAHKRFIEKYDGALLPGQTIYGLFQIPDEKPYILENIILKTIYAKTKQKWPGIEDWYIISDDGRGNPIGVNPKGEVFLSDHDSGFEQVKLADSFEEFLHKLLTDTLY